MRFDEEKKKSIRIYLLEKIAQKDTGISKAVAEAFSINQNTVHTYINELVADGIIERIKRGQYRLIKRKYQYHLKRSKGHLNTDTYAYDHCLYEHVKDFAPNVVSIWSYSFSEMINNVMDHSMAESLDILVEQDYLNTYVGIKDDGVGIFRKIKEYFGYSSLDEAICELFKGKLTTDSTNHSGEGIFFSSKMMDNYYIVSDGKVFTNNKYDDSTIFSMVEVDMKGTYVMMSLSNFTHRTAKGIFDLYANVDGGFTKTQIPIKNIFDSLPVSRSQAKRVCNRLEKFKEVTLDFEEVQWMGQGFAHQLFVVFGRQHPEIRIEPINMNEDVRKMYVHVTQDA